MSGRQSGRANGPISGRQSGRATGPMADGRTAPADGAGSGRPTARRSRALRQMPNFVLEMVLKHFFDEPNARGKSIAHYPSGASGVNPLREGHRLKVPVDESGNCTAHWPPDSCPLEIVAECFPDLVPGALGRQSRMAGEVHERLNETLAHRGF